MSRRELDAHCPFCRELARESVSGVICHAVRCACGAIALGAPPWDGDEIVDDAIGYFSLKVHPLAASFMPAEDWFSERGVATADGGSSLDPFGQPVVWRWFKRIALAPPAGWRPAPSDDEALDQAREFAARASARMEDAPDAAVAAEAYHDASAALFALAVYARRLGRAGEADGAMEELRRLEARFRALGAR